MMKIKCNVCNKMKNDCVGDIVPICKKCLNREANWEAQQESKLFKRGLI